MADWTGAGEAYFCVSGVRQYDHMPELRQVTSELNTVRKAFAALGMKELFTLPDGATERSHADLLRRVREWGAKVEPGQELTVVIYATGHGIYSRGAQEWFLAERDSAEDDEGSAVRPTELATAANRDGVRRVMLILDACYSGEGAIEAFASAGKAFHMVGGDRELCILTATPSYEEAQQGVFAAALAKALQEASVPSWDRSFLSLEEVEWSLAESMKSSKQKPQVRFGRDAGSHMLPNPMHIPSAVPNRWTSRRWSSWSSSARGVTHASDPGWFFTGRQAALSELWGLVDQQDRPQASVIYLTGPAGSGRTALLARMLTTAGSEDRAALPMVARHGELPATDITAVAISCRQKPLEEIRDDVVRRLAFDPLSPPDGLDRPWVILLDEADHANEPGAVLSWAERLARAGVAVVAVVDRAPVGLQGHVIDLGAATHDSTHDIKRYLKLRTCLGSRKPDDFELEGLATGTSGSWEAAARTADAWVEAANRGGDCLDEGLRAAAVSLSASRISTLAALGLDREKATTAAIVLEEVSGWDNWAGLTIPLWSMLASPVGEPPCDAALLRDAVPALGLARSQASPHAVRIPNPAPRPPRPMLFERLVAAVRLTATDWRQVDPAHLCALVSAAALHSDTDLLRDAGLLLACPPAAVTRALIRQKDGLANIPRVWSEVPAYASDATRELALHLAATRRGESLLSDPHSALYNGLGGALRVVSAARMWPNDELADVVAASFAMDGTSGAIATAHDDGQLVIWGADPLTMQATCPPPFAGSAVAGLVTSWVGGQLQVVAMSGHGNLARWSPDTPRASALPGSAATLLALDGTVLLLANETTVEVRDLTAGTASTVYLHKPPDRIVAARLPRGWVVWVAERDGLLTRYQLNDGMAATSASIAVFPKLSVLQVGASGDAIAVNSAGATVVPVDGGPARWFPVPPGGPVRSAVTTPTGEMLLRSLGSDGSRLDWKPKDDGEPLTVGWPEELFRIVPAGPGPEVVAIGRRSLTLLSLGSTRGP